MDNATDHEPSRAPTNRKRLPLARWIGSSFGVLRLFIYATAASLVFPQIFFPSGNPTVAIVASLATYGVGYVARPIGAFYLGHLGDTPWPQDECCSYACSSWGSRRWRSASSRPTARSACWRPHCSSRCGSSRVLPWPAKFLARARNHDTLEVYAPFGRQRLFRQLLASRRARPDRSLAAAVFLPLAAYMPDEPVRSTRGAGEIWRSSPASS